MVEPAVRQPRNRAQHRVPERLPLPERPPAPLRQRLDAVDAAAAP